MNFISNKITLFHLPSGVFYTSAVFKIIMKMGILQVTYVKGAFISDLEKNSGF